MVFEEINLIRNNVISLFRKYVLSFSNKFVVVQKKACIRSFTTEATFPLENSPTIVVLGVFTVN
jgi:hypothetical protein